MARCRGGANAMANKQRGGVVAQRFKRWRTLQWREVKSGGRPALPTCQEVINKQNLLQAVFRIRVLLSGSGSELALISRVWSRIWIG